MREVWTNVADGRYPNCVSQALGYHAESGRQIRSRMNAYLGPVGCDVCDDIAERRNCLHLRRQLVGYAGYFRIVLAGHDKLYRPPSVFFVDEPVADIRNFCDLAGNRELDFLLRDRALRLGHLSNEQCSFIDLRQSSRSAPAINENALQPGDFAQALRDLLSYGFTLGELRTRGELDSQQRPGAIFNRHKARWKQSRAPN